MLAITDSRTTDERLNCVKCKHYYETEDDTDVHGHCRMDTAHTDLISRADAIEAVESAYKEPLPISLAYPLADIINILNALPSADVVQGEWILVKGSNGKDYHKCSKCLHTQEITGVKNYCAVCGARMKGGAE